MKIFINKDLKLKENEVAVMAILNAMYSNKDEVLVTHLNAMYKYLTNVFFHSKEKHDRVIIENLKKGIKSLASKGILSYEEENNTYMFNKNNISVDVNKNQFTVIYLNELQKIFQESNKPFAVFKFFVLLVGTINSNTKEWHMSQEYMASMWGYSNSSVSEYLKQLENMKLIYVHRHNKHRDDGTFRRINNFYGRYKDKDKIIIEAEVLCKSIKTKEEYTALNRRSIKMQYNSFIKGGKKYKTNPSLIDELYNNCILYNESLKVNPLDIRDDNFNNGNKLDLSVFNYFINKSSKYY